MRTLWRARIARDAGAVRAPRRAPGRADPASGPTCSGSRRSRPTTRRPTRSRATRSLSVGRRAKYLVWEFDDGDRIVLHLSQAGRLDVEEPPKKTKPRGAVARFVFVGDAGLDGAGVAVLVREYGTQRKASWWVLGAGRRGPAGRPRTRAGQRGVRRLHPHQRLAGATSPPTCATSTSCRASAAAGATTSCTGPSCRPSPRCARSAPSEREALLDRRHRRPGRGARARAHAARAACRRPSWAAASRCTAAFGEPCPTPCGDTLRRVSFESYEMTYCPTCQTGGKVLADRRLSRLLK